MPLGLLRHERTRPNLAGGPGSNDEHVAEAEGFELSYAPLLSDLCRP